MEPVHPSPSLPSRLPPFISKRMGPCQAHPDAAPTRPFFKLPLVPLQPQLPAPRLPACPWAYAEQLRPSGAGQGPRLPSRSPHLVRKQPVGLATLLTPQGRPWSCPCGGQQTAQSHTQLRATSVAADGEQGLRASRGALPFRACSRILGAFSETPMPCRGVLRALLQSAAEGGRIMQQTAPWDSTPHPPLTPLSPMHVFPSVSHTHCSHTTFCTQSSPPFTQPLL